MNSTYPSAPVLVIDDEPQVLTATEGALAMAGVSNTVTCQDPTKVARLVESTEFSAITLDIVMPAVTGPELLPVIRQAQPDASVIIMSGVDELETAVGLMREGAFDYLVKPVPSAKLVTVVRNAIENWQMVREIASLKESLTSGALRTPEAFSHILTENDRMHGIFGYVEAIARTSLPVLISGETGVGKELLARSIHLASEREGNFVPVNTAGLDDLMIADTLFGHVKGAFTGADKSRMGLIAQASGGTLFLDEIGDMSAESQIKLLRLVQEREYYPLGSDIPARTDARFVFATNRNLEELIDRGEFRRDLYFRLRSHRVIVPPLRERPSDIPLLVERFLDQAARETGKARPTPHRDLYGYLMLYDYPGNVRELQGLVYDAVVRHTSGLLSRAHFNSLAIGPLRSGDESDSRSASPTASGDQGSRLFSEHARLPSMAAATEDLIQEALERAGGNRTKAAELIGLTRSALSKRLNKKAPAE